MKTNKETIVAIEALRVICDRSKPMPRAAVLARLLAIAGDGIGADARLDRARRALDEFGDGLGAATARYWAAAILADQASRPASAPIKRARRCPQTLGDAMAEIVDGLD